VLDRVKPVRELVGEMIGGAENMLDRMKNLNS
jgi:hypothetical protein